MPARSPLRFAAAALLALLCAACAGSPKHLEGLPRSAEEELSRIARIISAYHVTPVEAEVLLREATRAIDPNSTDLATALRQARALGPAPDETELTITAIKAMAATLHDHSGFVPRSDLDKMNHKGLEGIGLIVGGERKPYPLIVNVLAGGPAAAAGLTSGLELRLIENRDPSPLSLDEIVGLLLGPKGSQVHLSVALPGEAARQVTIARERVTLGGPDCRILGASILYLGVRHTIGKETVEAIRGFVRLVNAPITQRVLLDLRGNRGGMLQASAELAGTFIETGPLLSIDARTPDGRRDFKAVAHVSAFQHAEVAALIDGVTGSGAAAVAAALQDNHRGSVLGAPSARGGSIDVLYDAAGGAVRLTVAMLLRANGEPLEERGVTPDVTGLPPSGAPLSDEPCPHFSSPDRVIGDPAVAQAAAWLLRNKTAQ